jgi:hypothetical protein
VLGDVLLHGSAVQLPLDPEGPGECSAAECQGETLGRGVQVRTSAREPPLRVRERGEAGSLSRGDDSQQLVPGGALSASQAGADGLV